MMRLSLMALMLLCSSGLQAQSKMKMCEQERLQRCGELDKSNPLGCLEKMYACGEYEMIIDAPVPADPTYTLAHNYYKGVAYFGSRVRNRSEALRCLFNRKVKQNLHRFLNGKQNLYEKTGNYGSIVETDWVYHSTRILTEINHDMKCLQPSMIPEEVTNHIQNYTTDNVERIFIGKPSDNGIGEEIATAKADYQSKIKGVISAASNIETMINLKDTEIQASKIRTTRILSQIEAVAKLEPVFDNGWVTSLKLADENSIDASQCEELSANSYSDFSPSQISDAYECWQNITLNKYNQLLGEIGVSEDGVFKQNTLKVAKEVLSEGQQIVAYYQAIAPFPSAGLVNEEFKRLEQVIDELEKNIANDSISEIEELWFSYGQSKRLCRRPASAPWFCKLDKK